MTSLLADRGKRVGNINTPAKAQSGFTIIELIAVIAIIGVLIGMVLPAIARARRHAFKVAAKAEVRQIEAAWRAYLGEYHAWPSNFAENVSYAVTGELARAMNGEAAGQLNPRRIPFLNFARRDADQNPVNPWAGRGSPPENCRFFCKFDADYNNVIPGTGNPTNPPMSDLTRPVAVWTINPDAKPDERDYIIGSWQE